MFKKVTFGMAVIGILGFSLLTTQAQDLTLIENTPAEGELTKEDYAIFYTYEGHESDIIVIDMKPVEILGDLNLPAIIVRDPKGRDLVRTDSFGSVSLVTELPTNGEYTIIATRSDDASGDSVGEFTIEIKVASEIKLGDSIEAEIDSEGADYYVYRGEDDLTLTFNREGDFAPAFSINKLNDKYSPGTLDALLTISGELNVPFELGPIPGGALYVIKLEQGLFDFNFTTVNATYTLQVSEAGQ